MLAATLLLGTLFTPAQPDPLPQDLTRLSLEELVSLEVTTASRHAEPLLQVPAALDVITGDEVRRSGATRLSDALRLTPAVVAARIDAWRRAIGVRGGASVLSRNLLVEVDGRSVYTPLFAGVYWEVQDTFLHDVDRIEVNRGPVGSLFGANAMNGIVSVFTKPAGATQGLTVLASAGSEQRFRGGVRYGGALGDTTHYRVYAKHQDHDDSFSASGPGIDDWRISQGGFRLDSRRDADRGLTVQGDVYAGELGQRTLLSFYTPPFQRTAVADVAVSGANLLARGGARALGGTVEAAVYWDRTAREETYFEETRHTFELDAQHHVERGRHTFDWGVEARRSRGTVDTIETIRVEPRTRDDDTAALFLQDEVRFRAGEVRLGGGVRLEWNDYSGWHAQPAFRALWTDATRHTVWASVGRAVRTISRAERDATIDVSLAPDRPLFGRILPDPDFRPESVWAVQGGHRRRWNSRILTDVSLFRAAYDDVAGRVAGAPFVAPPGRTILPVTTANLHTATTWGGEARAIAALGGSLRVEAWYAHLRTDVELAPGDADPASAATVEGSAPRHQAALVAAATLDERLELDGMLRYVSALPGQNVPAFAALDLRVALRDVGPAEIAVAGHNLLDPRHAEWAGGASQVERSVHATVTLRF